MYEEYYGLKERPFSLTPDPEYLYLSEKHSQALACLTLGLEVGTGFIQFTGETGSGKTTIIRSLLERVGPNIKSAYIINPQLSFIELLKVILTKFDVAFDPRLDSKVELLGLFDHFLIEQKLAGNIVVLLIDEAQNLPLPALEELRMLSNVETTKEKLLQIVFIGQPALKDKLSLAQIAQLRQRITVRFHLNPLDLWETEEYISHRLRVAGSRGDIFFNPDASKLIHEFAQGLPRLINVACDAVLMRGYAEEKKFFDGNFVQEVIADLTKDLPKVIGAMEGQPAASSSSSWVDPTLLKNKLTHVERLFSQLKEQLPLETQGTVEELMPLLKEFEQRLPREDKGLDEIKTWFTEQMEAWTSRVDKAQKALEAKQIQLAARVEAVEKRIQMLRQAVNISLKKEKALKKGRIARLREIFISSK